MAFLALSSNSGVYSIETIRPAHKPALWLRTSPSGRPSSTERRALIWYARLPRMTSPRQGPVMPSSLDTAIGLSRSGAFQRPCQAGGRELLPCPLPSHAPFLQREEGHKKEHQDQEQKIALMQLAQGHVYNLEPAVFPAQIQRSAFGLEQVKGEQGEEAAASHHEEQELQRWVGPQAVASPP